MVAGWRRAGARTKPKVKGSHSYAAHELLLPTITTSTTIMDLVRVSVEESS